jgi:hypothetical protein
MAITSGGRKLSGSSPHIMTEPGKAKVPRGVERPLAAQHLVCGFDDVVIRMVAAIDDQKRSVAGHLAEVDDGILSSLVYSLRATS